MKRDHWTMCAVMARSDCMMLGGRKKKMGPGIGQNVLIGK